MLLAAMARLSLCEVCGHPEAVGSRRLALRKLCRDPLGESHGFQGDKVTCRRCVQMMSR